ncbi:hypothetical protein HYX03_00605 [Candidatus Woesearchaeota archaeon]|nr:hypothetical protein [Candidatus Woesearchaeota archaeon]
MAKLKPSSVGLALGLLLAVIQILRSIVAWLFPNFVAYIIKNLTFNAISIQPPIVTAASFIIGLIALFAGGFVLGTIFGMIYNWAVK